MKYDEEYYPDEDMDIPLEKKHHAFGPAPQKPKPVDPLIPARTEAMKYYVTHTPKSGGKTLHECKDEDGKLIGKRLSVRLYPYALVAEYDLEALASCYDETAQNREKEARRYRQIIASGKDDEAKTAWNKQFSEESLKNGSYVTWAEDAEAGAKKAREDAKACRAGTASKDLKVMLWSSKAEYAARQCYSPRRMVCVATLKP